MSKTRVLLLFGGQSAEHEVSIISARSVYAAIDRQRYEPILVGITRQGCWLLAGSDASILEHDTVDDMSLPVVYLASTGQELKRSEASPDDRGVLFDVVFPLLHGPFGEDGTIQGLLELVGMAYVGAGVAASSVGMDKALAKLVFNASGLAQTAYQVIRRNRWHVDPDAVVFSVEKHLQYPLFVKPANMGSSVGVSKAIDVASLTKALDIAAQYDVKMLVEESVEDCHEVECAVLGNDSPRASIIGEIIPGADFYDYQTKYLDDRSELMVPANLSFSVSNKVQGMAIKAFQAIDCMGLARVDFFVRRADDFIYINEINTMPGFTPISMYPMLWQASGLTYPDLIDQLIQLALERRAERKDLRRAP
ncbi:MAG: D-alanine--D-alanine ligase family protein [Arenicellales bacterium]|nr:D-alanine--D-alanine ligase family protein [Arenicellales bacterium]